MSMNDDPQVYKQMPIPVSFRCLETGSEEIEYTTRTVSIFHNGFVMSSPRRLRVGGLLSLRLRVPPEISGSPFIETRCTGYVKAEQKLKDGSLGYRVEIETALPS
jgi:hypothetical protein